MTLEEHEMLPGARSASRAHGAPGAATKSVDDWDAHWSSYADSTTANPAQAYRRKLILDALDLGAAARPVRLLELGSGQGDFARELSAAHAGIEICGLDLATTGVAIARRKVPGGAFFQQDFTQPLTVPDQYRGWATHAVCSEVLEHVDDPVAVLANVRALMAPGCRLVITVPGGPMSAFDRHIGHREHFTADRLARTLRAAGLGVSDLRGAGFPFFNLYRLAVVARGERLIEDASADDGRTLPLTARATIKVFSWLFRMNQHTGARGWQMVAVAVEPPATTAPPALPLAQV